MKNLTILTFLIFSIIFAQPGVNEIPTSISFQGVLQDGDGNIYEDGEYNVMFRIFDFFDTNEMMIYEREYTVSLSNGVFSLMLVDLPYGIRKDAQLEIQVGEEILSPRQIFSSVPFAFSSYLALHANKAEEADTSVVSHYSQYSVNAEHAMNAVHADTASVASAIIGGIESVEHANHANFADSSDFSLSSQHSIHADTAGLAIGIVGGIEVDDVQNATYADTAYYVQQAQSALTAVTSQNSTNATYADTAEFVDLSQHGQNMQVVQSDNAQITLRSSGDGSASFVTLIAKEPDGDQTELRVMNEGNTNELKVYDATNDNYLMTVGNDGKVTANAFVGDGSGLTGINSGATIGFPNSEVFNGVIPSEWTDLDLSSVIGDNKAMVLLKVDLTNWENSQSNYLIIRPKGDINEYLYSYNGSWSSATSSSLNVLGLATQSQTTIIYTNDDGVIQIKAPNVIDNAPASINVAFFMH